MVLRANFSSKYNFFLTNFDQNGPKTQKEPNKWFNWCQNHDLRSILPEKSKGKEHSISVRLRYLSFYSERPVAPSIGAANQKIVKLRKMIFWGLRSQNFEKNYKIKYKICAILLYMDHSYTHFDWFF